MTNTLGEIIADFSTQPTVALPAGTTSMTLRTSTDSDGVALPAGKYFFTLDRRLRTKEHIVCDVSGTAVTNIKHISVQGVETSGTNNYHAQSCEIVITDFAHIKKINDLLDGTTDLNSLVPLKYDGTATIDNANHLATKKYVDDTAVVGAPNASTSTKGLAKLSVAPASASNPISVGDNDPRVPTQSENDAMAGTVGTPSSSNKFVTATDPLYTGMVKLTTDQTVAGIKTFTIIPVLPASDPTTANQAVRKSYADSLVTETTGSLTIGSFTVNYNKRGSKFYYNFLVTTGEPIIGGNSSGGPLTSGEPLNTVNRIATLLGGTVSTATGIKVYKNMSSASNSINYVWYNGTTWINDKNSGAEYFQGGYIMSILTSITLA